MNPSTDLRKKLYDNRLKGDQKFRLIDIDSICAFYDGAAKADWLIVDQPYLLYDVARPLRESDVDISIWQKIRHEASRSFVNIICTVEGGEAHEMRSLHFYRDDEGTPESEFEITSSHVLDAPLAPPPILAGCKLFRIMQTKFS